MKKNYYPRILSYLEISSLKLKEIVLLIPILSLLLLCIILNFNILEQVPYIFKVIRFIIFFLMPGFYLAILIGENVKLCWEGIIVLDILISTSISMFICIYLSFILSELNQLTISYSLLFVTLFSYLICRSRILKSEILRRKLALFDTSKILFWLIFSFFIGFILIIRVIPLSYWRGWDPWVNTPVVRTIVKEGLNPFELPRRFQVSVAFSGFYYFLASVKVFTGISLYTINRFGGPVLAGLASMITYLVVKRLEGTGAGLLASFFLLLNPFFVTRFSMALRENFAYIFLLIILYISLTGKNKPHRAWTSRLSYPLSIGLFLAVTLISHSLAPLIAYGFILLELLLSLLKGKKTEALELILAFTFSLVLASPYLRMIASTINWVIWNQVLLDLERLRISFLIISAILVVLLASYKQLGKSNLKRKYKRIWILIIIITLLLGAFNSILFPKTFEVLGSYNPPIKQSRFATSILSLAFLGLISAFWFPTPSCILSFGLIVVLILNLTNLNVAFPLFRLIIYISWLLSYGAIKGLKLFDNLGSIKISNINCNLNLGVFKKNVIIRLKHSIIVLIAIIIIISPLIIIDFNSSKPSWRYPNFNQEDVDSAINFVSLIGENDVVVPQDWTLNLLRYVEIDLSKIINDRELYSTSDPQNFSQIILSKRSNVSRALVFIMNRWLLNENMRTPQLDMLNKYGIKQQIGTISFYMFEIPFEFIEETLVSPIIFKIPKGPQWVNINITKFDFSKADSIIIEIINNNSTLRRFFLKISDIYENSSDKIIFNLRSGKSSYQIPLNNIKDKLDLSKLNKITFCFSWWDDSEIDLIIESITLVSIK